MVEINYSEKNIPTLLKSKTGIQGLDEITSGGLPQGRPTLVCGNPGCAKTLMAMEYLVHGAREYDEPGVFIAFEEKENELILNFASLGFDLENLIARKKLLIDFVYIERSEFEVTGEYDLEGLFIRIESAIDSIGAKRIVLDTIEALFSGLKNESILRAELRRLFRWLKDKGITAIITGERSELNLTRFGIEEYVTDCVILLDHRVNEQIATRRLKIIKYRGSNHGTNEFPFVVGSTGLSVLPITSLGLDYPVSNELISSGIEGLDLMLDGKGYYKGSAVLVSGSAGTGKTSLAGLFANAACNTGKKVLFIASEESASQIIRNMENIGLDLAHWGDKGLLVFSANRPTTFGIEMHLVSLHQQITEYDPDVLIIDPISNLISSGTIGATQAMLCRLLDFLKMKGITVFLTDLCSPQLELAGTEMGISSLADTWISIENIIEESRRKRHVSIVKSRGMNHSNRICNFSITGAGIKVDAILNNP
jgi:circadian clock protein KaiC